MKKGPVALRRATYGIGMAMLGIAVLEILRGAHAVWGDETQILYSWAGWWRLAFELVFFSGVLSFAKHATTQRSRVVAIAGLAIVGANIFSAELLDFFFWFFPTSTFPFLLLDALTAGMFGVAVALFWTEKTIEDQHGGLNILHVSVFFLIIFWVLGGGALQVTEIHPLVTTGPLAFVGIAAAVTCYRQARGEERSAGLETELGVELVWRSMVWRVGLAVVSSISAAFFWKPDIYSAAGLSSALGVLVVPAAYGASQMAEQIVRETKPRFDRVGWMWWLAAGLWIAQVGWLLLMGPSLGAFVPAVAAVVVEMFAWNTFRDALGDWARSEGEAREALSGPPMVPIFATGALLVAAFVTAFFSVEYAIWVVVAGALAAAVAAYLLILATQATLQSVRAATYIES